MTLEVECIDRMYLNLYVQLLQTERGIAHYFRKHLGHKFASTALMEPMTRRFVSSIERFADHEHIELFTFPKGQRKEDLAKAYLRDFKPREGVLFIGKAQEMTRTPSTRCRHNAQSGASYADLYMTKRMVNQYYFYCMDEDFGPFFLKLCSYFPYNGRLCINGHEYVKRQLGKRGIRYEALDNGIAWCEDPKALQNICDSLDAEKIVQLTHKWFQRRPHPFTDEDRAGQTYKISMLQTEFALTQVLDRPVAGRVFFEQVIRDNLDIGRPAGPRPADLRPSGHEDHTGTLPHARHHRWRHPLAARRLQVHTHQAVLQGRTCPADRDDDQQRVRLQDRQARAEPPRAEGDRLRCQPPAARGPAHQPRLDARRGRLRQGQRAAGLRFGARVCSHC